MKKILQDLVSIANKCDQKGLYKEADAIENIIRKIAEAPGTPVGKPFKDQDGKMQQRYRTADGHIVLQEVPAAAETTTKSLEVEEPVTTEEQSKKPEEESFISRYNPLKMLIEGLGGNPTEIDR